MEVPALNSGNGQELRHLHKVVKQHMRAHQAMKYNSLETFMSLVIELKFDQSLILAWQNHSKDQKGVPSYTKVLEFIDLRTRASENVLQDGDWKRDSGKKSSVNSYVVNIQRRVYTRRFKRLET